MANQVSVLNVLDVQPIDVAMWVSANALNFKMPEPGPNSVYTLNTELVPLMAGISNRILFLTEMYVMVVGATPAYDPKSKDGNSLNQDLNKKKDILYRALQSLESSRDTVGRMITATTQSIRANL